MRPACRPVDRNRSLDRTPVLGARRDQRPSRTPQGPRRGTHRRLAQVPRRAAPSRLFSGPQRHPSRHLLQCPTNPPDLKARRRLLQKPAQSLARLCVTPLQGRGESFAKLSAPAQNKASWSPLAKGTSNRSVRKGGKRSDNPAARTARAKRCCNRSAQIPSPRMRLPNSAS